MKELNISSSIRRKRPPYKVGKQNCLFPNLIQQRFVASRPNQVWCLDFTYLYLANGTPRYNCTIIDVYERRVVSSLNGARIDTQLAINTLSKAIQNHYPEKGLILHSDQGSQFSSKVFNAYCKQRYIQQSMSRAGCPYDNAVIERYFNTLKHECTNHYNFRTKEKMDEVMNKFEENWYNAERPHTYNNGLAPNQVYSNSTLL